MFNFKEITPIEIIYDEVDDDYYVCLAILFMMIKFH